MESLPLCKVDKTTGMILFKGITIYGTHSCRCCCCDFCRMLTFKKKKKKKVVWLRHSSGQLAGLDDSTLLQSGKLIWEVVAAAQCQGEGLLPFELYHMFWGGLGVCYAPQEGSESNIIKGVSRLRSGVTLLIWTQNITGFQNKIWPQGPRVDWRCEEW